MRIFAGFHYNTIAVVRFAAVALLLIAESASQGLPASDVHSPEDWRAIRTAVGRQEKLLHTASDKGTVMYRRISILGFYLDSHRRTITGFDVLERRDPLFDSITTSVICGPRFLLHCEYAIGSDQRRQGRGERCIKPIAILRIALKY